MPLIMGSLPESDIDLCNFKKNRPSFLCLSALFIIPGPALPYRVRVRSSILVCRGENSD